MAFLITGIVLMPTIIIIVLMDLRGHSLLEFIILGIGILLITTDTITLIMGGMAMVTIIHTVEADIMAEAVR